MNTKVYRYAILAVAILLVGGYLMVASLQRPRESSRRAPEPLAGAEMPQLSALGYLGESADTMDRRRTSAASSDARGEEDWAQQNPFALASSGVDRYLIKNASLAIEVENARQASALVTQAAVGAGGYVSNLRESVDGLGRHAASMEVRVPCEKLDTALQDFDALGKVLSKQVSTQDVTEEYVDTESRTRNLKKTEERLLEHLSRTGELKQVLLIENELTRVREQIEKAEGRLRFLSHRIAYSTIQLSLQESPAAGPLAPTKTFSTGQVFSTATRALLALLQSIWVLIIWAAVWSVLWVPGIAVVWWAYRHWFNKPAE